MDANIKNDFLNLPAGPHLPHGVALHPTGDQMVPEDGRKSAPDNAAPASQALAVVSIGFTKNNKRTFLLKID